MSQYIKPEDEKKVQPFLPSDKHAEVVNRVFQRFTDMRVERDKTRREFDNRTLTDYVNDSMDAYNGIVSDEIKASKEDWQSIIWDQETRGKVKTIVSMIVGAKPFISLVGETEKDDEFTSDLLKVYEDSWEKENGGYKLYQQSLSAAAKGTAIVEEMYVEEKHTIKEIINVDQETGQVNYKEDTVIRGGYGHVKTGIVPLLDFYPNENNADIKEDCCVVKTYTRKKFLSEFGKYKNAQYVSDGIWGGDSDNIYYKSISQNKDELIEVIKYYNEIYDEYVILANGIWLNSQTAEAISPIPFHHHRLPFAKVVFELADEECFYGKSFPDILSGEQETRNALLRLMIDQEILATNRPIMIGSGSEIESYELFPGKPIKFTGEAKDIFEMPFNGSTQSSFQLLQLLKRNANENSSIDTVTQGVSSGGRKTAREAVILDENAKRVSATFQIFIYKLLRDRAELRISNIKQFYTDPIQYSALKDKYGKTKRNGEGEPIMQSKMREIPVAQAGKKPEWVKMTTKMKRVNVQVRFIQDYEMALNRSSRIELSRELLDESKNNPLMNADEATIDYLESIGKNPDQFYIKPKPQDQKMQAENAAAPMMPQPEANQVMPPQ